GTAPWFLPEKAAVAGWDRDSCRSAALKTRPKEAISVGPVANGAGRRRLYRPRLPAASAGGTLCSAVGRRPAACRRRRRAPSLPRLPIDDTKRTSTAPADRQPDRSRNAAGLRPPACPT